MPHQYPTEFRQPVLALHEAGAKVADIAADLDVWANTIYSWRNQHLIDTDQRSGKSSTELAELKTARREIERLRAESEIRASDLMKESTPPKAVRGDRATPESHSRHREAFSQARSGQPEDRLKICLSRRELNSCNRRRRCARLRNAIWQRTDQ